MLLSNLARAMNSREVSTVRTSVATSAACMLALPVEKFSIAGTRPNACSATMVTTVALALGRKTATRSPGSLSAASRRPRAVAPISSLS